MIHIKHNSSYNPPMERRNFIRGLGATRDATAGTPEITEAGVV
jgi:hypothetical protein